MSAVLEVAGVSVAIGAATLLDRIDWRIKPGEMVAIVGPNGAGKSTLLRLLSADLRPTRGAVKLGGRDLHSYTPSHLALRRAMLSQHVSVSFPFTVEEIVRMGRGSQSMALSPTLVDAAIDEVDLHDFRHRELPTLSGGEQQRAHLARVLVQLACGEAVHGPGVLLLDEPTSSLDLKHQIALVEIARRRAHAGTAVVAVLHDLNLAVRFAHRIVVMHHGRVAADGIPVDTITGSMLHEVFGIDVVVERTRDGTPFLLPQTMRKVDSRS
ncbi:MAG: Hemin import ATP-binding protein HmuV [Tardiphaga sp.]|nr:Hemin import ATP-binding protein HmuV [Tardiphaga sp.]